MVEIPNVELDSILQEFEDRPTSFEALELRGRLVGLRGRRREAGLLVTNELNAEIIAWELLPDYSRKADGWGTYYGPAMEWANGISIPSISDITFEVIDYWANRCQLAKHPLLRLRYADVAWDFKLKTNHRGVGGEIPKVLIDNVVDSASRALFLNEIEGYRSLRRSLQVALQIRDALRIGNVRDALIDFEAIRGMDHLPGTWGYCFDLLVKESQNVKLSTDTESKIVDDMEDRLSRLSSTADVEKLDPHHVEYAALRLAWYYRKKCQHDNLTRVMRIYTQAFMRKAETNVWVGAAWLEDVYRKLIEFNLHSMAKEFQPIYRESAQKMSDIIPSQRLSIPIDGEKLSELVAYAIAGSWDETFAKFVGLFLPIVESNMEMLRNAMSDRVILDLFPPTLLDSDGRTLARIGTFTNDPEGHLALHYANIIFKGNALMIRSVVEGWCEKRGISVADITEFLSVSPLFNPSNRPIIESAIRAYLAKDWIVAIHLMVPQIEHSIRRLVATSGRSILRTMESEHGGFLLKNFDDLVGDEAVEKCFGTDTVFYLRMLLTDQRGWNIRNNVSHGITQIAGFNSMVADRLLHVLLLLGEVRGVEFNSPKQRSPTGLKLPI